MIETQTEQTAFEDAAHRDSNPDQQPDRDADDRDFLAYLDQQHDTNRRPAGNLHGPCPAGIHHGIIGNPDLPGRPLCHYQIVVPYDHPIPDGTSYFLVALTRDEYDEYLRRGDGRWSRPDGDLGLPEPAGRDGGVPDQAG